MILKAFKRTGPGTIFLIVMVLLIMWSGTLIVSKSQMGIYFDIDPMPFYGFVSLLTGTHPQAGIILTVALVILMAFLVVNLNTTLFFINERTFLPALFYILLTGLFPQYQVLNPALPAAVFLMLAIKRIMEAYRIQGTAYSFYDAGLLIGIGSLFYANLIWFGIIIFVGMSLLRSISLKEILLAVFGIATPFVLGTAVYYVLGKSPTDLSSVYIYNLFGKHTAFALAPPGIVALIFTSVLILASLLNLFSQMGSKKIQSRKIFSLLIWILVISVLLYFTVSSVSVEMIYIGAVPVSYLLAHYFVFMRRKVFPEIVFGLFFILILSIQLWYILRS